jgi:ribosome maturation factor RimP
VLEPVVAGSGYDLEALSVTPAGRRRVLRVVVDRDGGVDLDDIAELSRTVAHVLDTSEAMGAAPYVLEISSPGVDRPLTEPRHWRRAVGRTVSASLREGGRVTGRLAAADETAATIDGVRYEYPQLGRGRVQVEWS